MTAFYCTIERCSIPDAPDRATDRRGRAFPALHRRLPRLSLRSASDQRDVGWQPRPRRPPRRPEPHGDRLPRRRPGRLRPPPAGHPDRGARPDRPGRTPDRQGQHRVAAVRGRGLRSWERDPHYYGQILAASLAPQALFAFASETDRARRVLSKLRQVPRLVQAARDNVKDPPAIFVKTGIDTFNGVVTFIDADLPRAFAGIDDMHLLADLADASTEATQALSAYAQWLETEVRPRTKASFRLGRERFERKLELDEGLSYSCERLLLIAERELAQTQEAFRTAGRSPRQRRPGGSLANGQGCAPRARHADRHRARAGRRAEDVPGPQRRPRRAGRRGRAGGAQPGLPALVGGQPVDARPVRDPPGRGHLLPDRRAALLARGAPDRTPARPQSPDAVEHLDARGVPRPLPPLPAPAQGRVEGAAVDLAGADCPTWKAGPTTASR